MILSESGVNDAKVIEPSIAEAIEIAEKLKNSSFSAGQNLHRLTEGASRALAFDNDMDLMADASDDESSEDLPKVAIMPEDNDDLSLS